MKKFITISLLFVSITLFCKLNVKFTGQNINISGDFDIVTDSKSINNETFTEITTNYNAACGNFYEAQLPAFSRIVSLPDNGNYIVEKFEYEKEVINIDNKILPNCFQDNIKKINLEYYETDAWFPEQIVKINKPVIMRNNRFSQIRIAAVQYNPAKNKIKIFKNINLKLKLDYGKSKNKLTNRNNLISNNFSKIVNANILPTGKNDNITEQKGSYLFIIPESDEVEAEITELANLKEKLGYNTQITDLGTTGQSNEQIKAYIQNAYDNWQNPPEFVVIVGDINGDYAVPSYFVEGGQYNPYDVTDHPYSLLDGDDYFPDVYVGRLSFQTLSQLETIVTKLINYQTNPYTDINWFQQALMICPYLETITSYRETIMLTREKMLDYNYTVVDTFIYPNQAGQSLLASTIDNGYTFINFRGTGHYDCWTSYYGYYFFENENIYQLNNGFMLPMITSMTCAGGDFAAEDDSNCFGEAWLNAGTPTIPKGAIGFIGSSEWDTQTTFNNVNDIGIYQGITNENLHKCGEMLLREKMELYLNYPDAHAWGGPTDSDQFYFYVYNLLGDPGLTVWTDIPREIELDFTEEISPDANYLQCQVATEYDNENFCIALTGEEGLITTAYTNENGLANLEIVLEPGEYKVTASKQGHIPKTKDLQVTTENSISLTEVNFSDEIIAGSELDLDLTIQNNTDNIAENIDLELIANDDYIDVPAPQAQINEILSGDNETITFALDLGNNWLDYNDTELFLAVNSNLGEQQFMIPVLIKSPELTVADFNFDNNDNILLPDGETNFTISMENIGSINSGNFTALLSTTEENVEIVQDNSSYNNIDSNDIAEGTNFSVNLINQTDGDVINCSLEIEQEDDIVQNIDFNIPVGKVDSAAASYSNFNYIGIESRDDINLQIPEYNWIEIEPGQGGIGTNLDINYETTDGYTGIVELPFNFVYDENGYQAISICSNGWIAFGNQQYNFFRNRIMPSGTGPAAMLAPFWDHLVEGNISTAYIEEEHIFVIEWYNFKQPGYEVNNTFQVILFDSQFYGNKTIKFQYKEINNVDMEQHYATVGIENFKQDEAILFTFANNYSETAHNLSNESAILFKFSDDSSFGFLQSNIESFSCSLIPDTTLTFPLTLSNIGSEDANYEIEFNHNRKNNTRNIENDQIIRANNNFVPGMEWTANCYLIHNDIDGEGIYGIKLDFPEGCVVNSASNIGSLEYNGETGDGIELSWGFGNGEIEHTTTPISFGTELFIDNSVTEPITVEWYIEGDGSGAEPHFTEGETTYEPSQSNHIYLEYPVGGEEMVFDIEETIAWHYYGEIEAVDIFIKAADIHNDWQVIAENISNDLSYEFTPPAPLSEHYKIKIADVNGSDADISDEFTITALDFIYPAQGTAIQYGEEQTIEWENLSTIAEVDLQITTDNGDNWQMIADNITNDGDFIYDFTSEPSDNCELMISASNNSQVVNYSGKFTISESPVEWLSTENLSGEIAGNQSEEIIFEIDTNGLEEDSYYANIQITSDIGQVINIPVNLNVTTNTNENSISPSSLSLNNYPNPFNPTTIISFKLVSAAKENAKIEIYNLKGQKVKTLLNRKLAAGNHRVVWNGDDDNGKPVGSGVYFYKLKIDDILKSVKKCLLVK